MLALSVAELARALGGEVVHGSRGEQVVAPGIGHSPDDRSVSITFGPGAPDGYWITCFGAGDWRAERERVKAVMGGQAMPAVGRTMSARPRPLKGDASALWDWNEARHPAGTRVEAYLRTRGLELPAEAADHAIRYQWDYRSQHTRAPMACMVALVRDILTDTARAIHRTFISWADTNYEVNGHTRQAFGPIRGGAVKLIPLAGPVLGIGEGVESTLSLRLISEFGERPVWSLLNAAGVAAFPILPGIECLWIAVDNDASAAGRKAAAACRERWARAGRRGFLVEARAVGRDLNDLAQGRDR